MSGHFVGITLGAYLLANEGWSPARWLLGFFCGDFAWAGAVT